ncbi:acyl-CoA reductase [Mesonia sp. MT50]|uniref:Acyl-CoA reductase n=1 Tax=Mesonia profundi TaxID=3070998 RepID=A0ABU1A5I4_9FLAO|nr:acyl-CoA reductase [Mesonia profundi]MDQ7918621.1 acyl-CoA reductase [Mesonia profundi]
MNVEARIKSFYLLGNSLKRFLKHEKASSTSEENFFNLLNEKVDNAIHYNGWFTKKNILFSLQQWSEALEKEKLEDWLSHYEIPKDKNFTVAIIMAGNIPLVGFHDFLCVLLSGNKVLIKQSSNDDQILPVITQFLEELEPAFKERISFTKDRLENFDAVIATGSNNTARYFEYYFSKKPHIIRKNRNSVAILTGNESKEELAPLGEDIFRYYGLGCRNVSKMYVPKEQKLDYFFEAVYDWHPIIDSNKYANNYDYNKAVYLMSEFKILDNGFLILKKDESFSSPIASLFYEEYDDLEALKLKLEKEQENIQCIVSNGLDPQHIPFGKTQQPSLTDYADQVDTMKFLIDL